MRPRSIPRSVAICMLLVLSACITLFSMLTASAKPVPTVQAKSVAPQWSMLTSKHQRNMVNLGDKNMPTFWSVEEGKFKNIKWSANVHAGYIGQPVIAHGNVFVGANNQKPRDPNNKGHKAVLMAFDEANGALRWQITHDYPAALPGDVHTTGLLSTPAVDERRLYYVTPGCEVICANADDGKVNWRYDMMKQLCVAPYMCNICSPLVVGELVYVNTGNGRDGEGKLPAPAAPSFVAFNKKTGALVWQSNLPGKNIIEGSWSSPTCAMIHGVPQVIFAGGDAVIYSFEPDTGTLIWKCDCLPIRQKPGGRKTDLFFIGAPVVVKDRLFIGMGETPDGGGGSLWSWFLCLDITKRGDVSLRDFDAKAPANINSALVWSFGGPILPVPAQGRRAYFGSTISTAAVHDGLVYIPEQRGYMHCLDATTGQRYWEHDFKTDIWASPYWIDGKVYVGTPDGDVCIFAHGKNKRLIATIEMDEGANITPAVSNGVLYVQTRSNVYAIGKR